MSRTSKIPALALVAGLALPAPAPASNHREAPITALDHKADITDIYAFVSYTPDQMPNTPPSKVTLVLCVDPLLEPGNGPTLFPFDPADTLRDQGRQQPRRGGRRRLPVPLQDAVPAPGRVHRRGRRGRQRGLRPQQPRRPRRAAADRDLRQPRPEPAAVLQRAHAAQGQARQGPRPSRRLAPSTRCPATRVPAPWTTRSSTRRGLTAWRTECRSSPAPPTTRSGSTSAPPSTPRTSAPWAAACLACSRMPKTRPRRTSRPTSSPGTRSTPSPSRSPSRC